jgi:GTP-binding protein
MVVSPNTSPLAGREGSHLTAAKLAERLRREAEESVSLRVLPVGGGGQGGAGGGQGGDMEGAVEVQARGELQLGLLLGELAG